VSISVKTRYLYVVSGKDDVSSRAVGREISIPDSISTSAIVLSVKEPEFNRNLVDFSASE
jgi:hypothetical protein